VIANQQAPSSPIRLGVFGSIRQHPFLAAAPVLLFVVVALALGYQRQPTYTATARLSVGALYSSNVAAVPGVLQATESLAGGFARAIDATAVTQDTARRLGTSPTAVDGRLTATPIPDSPLIKISATGTSVTEAEQVANAASQSLVAYVGTQNSRSTDTSSIFKDFRSAALAYSRDQETVRRLSRAYANSRNPRLKSQLNQAEADAQTSLLRRESLRASYENGVQGVSGSPKLTIFSSASGASSDRFRFLQILLFIAVVAGLAVGAALATMRANRRLADLHYE
jgi:uncharacterized protein involved in exopolysaccharide biosynthesis